MHRDFHNHQKDYAWLSHNQRLVKMYAFITCDIIPVNADFFLFLRHVTQVWSIFDVPLPVNQVLF